MGERGYNILETIHALFIEKHKNKRSRLFSTDPCIDYIDILLILSNNRQKPWQVKTFNYPS